MSSPVFSTTRSAYGRIAVTTVGNVQVAPTHVRTIPTSVACWSSPNRKRVKATQLTKTAFRDERLNQLNSWQEALYHRILIAVGDGDELVGDAQFIRGFLFPLKTSLRVTQVDSALHALAAANLIGLGVKPDSRPYLWLVRPEAADSLQNALGEGGIRSRGNSTGYKYIKGNGGEFGATNKPNLGIADEFGITDSEVSKNREVWERIEREAKDYGLSTTIGSLRLAEQLANEFGVEEVIKAIHLCIDCQKWRYVEGILRTAKAEGRSVDDPPRKAKRQAIGTNVDEIVYDGENIKEWWGGLSE